MDVKPVNETKKKKKFKIPSAIVIIFGVLLFVIFLSWIIPHNSWTEAGGNINPGYSSQFEQYINQLNVFLNNKFGFTIDPTVAWDWWWINSGQAYIGTEWFNFFHSNWYISKSGKYGIFNIPLLLIAGFFNAWGVILYLLAIGAFVQIMLDSGTLESGTIVLMNKLKGRELYILPILFIFFAFGGTAFGMQEETLGLIPIIIPFLILAGFDAMTGMMVIVLGTTSGIAASVIDPFSVGVMANSLSTPTNTVSISDGIIIRMIMFIAFVAMGCFYVTWYGARVRKNKALSVEPERIDRNIEWAHTHLAEMDHSKEKMSTKERWAIAIFISAFIIMIFSLLPWGTWFPNIDSNNGWIIFSALFFDGVTFGQWYFLQLSMVFFIMAVIIGIIFKMSTKQIIKSFKVGFLGMLSVAIILTISRAVAIVITYSGLTAAMVNGLLGGAPLSGNTPILFAWILFPIFLILAVFIPSTSGLAGVTGPLIAPIVGSNQTAIIAVMVTYPIAQGVINMFSPTTGLVVAQAEKSQVSFGKAYKNLTGFAIATAIVGMTIVTIALPITQLMI